MEQKISLWHLRRACETVEEGGVIAYPTEAVYGLGCDPWDRDAVLKILRLKRRSISKGLIVIASSLKQLESLVDVSDQAMREKILATWPGPSTWILPAAERCPYWLKGQHAGLAVRVTDHPLCKALCDHVGPIVSTSANLADRPAAIKAWQVRLQFNEQLDYLLTGSTSGSLKPSTIKDALSDRVLR